MYSALFKGHFILFLLRRLFCITDRLALMSIVGYSWFKRTIYYPFQWHLLVHQLRLPPTLFACPCSLFKFLPVIFGDNQQMTIISRPADARRNRLRFIVTSLIWTSSALSDCHKIYIARPHFGLCLFISCPKRRIKAQPKWRWLKILYWNPSHGMGWPKQQSSSHWNYHWLSNS